MRLQDVHVLMDSFTCKGAVKNPVYTMQMDATAVDMLWDDSGEVGDVWSKCEALIVKMETVTLVGKGRLNLTCFVNLMFIGPCIIVIVETVKDQLDVTCYFISLLMCSTCFRH